MALLSFEIKRTIGKIILAPERWFYTRVVTPYLVKRMRKKEVITVVFVIYELGSWKTENLFMKMSSHKRFAPHLLVVPSLEDENELDQVKKYLERKQYPYYELNNGETIQSKFRPDIIFYQKPYRRCFKKSVFYRKNLSSLFCYMSYCFRNTTLVFNQNSFFHNYVWQIYVENDITQKELMDFMDNSGRNTIATGLSVMDDLMKEKSCYMNPWKPLQHRKRIIYAPHHTINHEIVNRSTFLQYADFMLEMAEKYNDKVQWAFKPHPVLRKKLMKLWGVERTDAYYERWATMDNSQLETGEYMGLFKYSDAMIHDCGSFMIEYLYTLAPVMYLDNTDHLDECTNQQTRLAYELHYKGRSKYDIEKFIQDVIADRDDRKKERISFYQKNLIPRNGSACDNVIKVILDESES